MRGNHFLRSTDLDEGVYYCQDRLANVVVVLDDGGSALEWVGYSAYGVPFMTPPGDMDGDGTVTAGDLATIGYEINLGNDPVKADMHLDGDVTSADAAEIRSLYKDVQFGREALSSVESVAGFKGYRAQGGPTGKWTGRHRIVDSVLGRWSTRDPLDYLDGSNAYAFLGSDPLSGRDPLGLANEADGPVVENGRVTFTGRDGSVFILDGVNRTTAVDSRPAKKKCDKQYRKCLAGAIGLNPMDAARCTHKLTKCYLRTHPGGASPGLPNTAKECDEYCPEDSYLGADATCFCKCAGNSPWEKHVRACLRKAYKSRLSPNDAHVLCYGAANARHGVPGMDVKGRLLDCYLKCVELF